MLADPHLELTKVIVIPAKLYKEYLYMTSLLRPLSSDSVFPCFQGLGLVLDAEGMLGTKRSKRYSAVVKDNVITHLNVEPDGSGVLSPHSSILLWRNCVAL